MKKKLAMLLALLLLAGAAACERRERLSERSEPSSETESLPDSEPEPEPAEEPSGEEDQDAGGAEQEVRGLLDALQAGDRDRIAGYVDYDDFLQLQPGQPDVTLLAIAARLQYEVLEAKADAASATVKVRLTNIDMHAVLGDYLKQAMDMEYNNALSEAPLSEEAMALEYERLFAGLLDQKSADTLDKTVDVRLAGEAGDWRIQPNDSLREGVFGDYWNANSQVGPNAGAGQR